MSALHIVATPIGNLEDLSPRAVKILNSVGLILAEDTRSFRVLAGRFGIQTPCESYHEHNELQRMPAILALLKEGSDVALVSDAGTPTISDPGFKLVRACHEQEITVLSVPGPCALIAALSVSGFETDRFTFFGFLPQKQGRRDKALQDAVESDATAIFYESPHRILKTLKALVTIAPQREICVVREITKIYEEIIRGIPSDVYSRFVSRQAIKGEYVLLVRKKETQKRLGKKKYLKDETKEEEE